MAEKSGRKQSFREIPAFKSFKAFGVDARAEADTTTGTGCDCFNIIVSCKLVADDDVRRERADSRNYPDMPRTAGQNVREDPNIAACPTVRNCRDLVALIDKYDLALSPEYTAQIA